MLFVTGDPVAFFQSFDCAARNSVDAAWVEEVESRFDVYRKFAENLALQGGDG